MLCKAVTFYLVFVKQQSCGSIAVLGVGNHDVAEGGGMSIGIGYAAWLCP